jgi:hypothetical protein
MYKMAIIFIFSIFFVLACSNNEADREMSLEQSQKSEQMALEKENPVGIYGKGITLKETTPWSQIMENPEQYEGKEVLLTGTVVEVCPKRGCWIDLSTDKDFEKVKVKVKDGEIVFPLSAKGSEALVEGVVEKLELSQKQAVNYLSHQAEEKGESFDSTSVTGPLTIWRLKGLGAEIKG